MTDTTPRILVMTVVHRPDDARIFYRQIRMLRDRGFTITYAAPWTAVGVAAPNDISVRDLPRSAGRHRLASLRAAARLLRTEAADHDLVLIHDPELLLAVRLVGVGRLPPVVWDVHEDAAAALISREWVPRPLRRPLALLIRRIERWAEHHLYLLLAEEGYRSRFCRDHPVVRNLPWSPDLPPRSGDEVDDEVPLVLYVGRVSRGRGFFEMLELGRRLRGFASLEMVGPVDPDLRTTLEAAVSAGDVRWHGFVPNDAIGPLLARARVGLCLLHAEPNYLVSMPTKILEFLAHGVPVVATPLPEVVALLSECGGGLLVEYRDVEDAESAVRRILAEPDLHTRLVGEARILGLAHTWEAEGARLSSTLHGWANREAID